MNYIKSVLIHSKQWATGISVLKLIAYVWTKNNQWVLKIVYAPNKFFVIAVNVKQKLNISKISFQLL